MLALAVRNLVKTYANGVQALRGIDLDVPQGDFFALLGPNGAGKTTLIGIITSLVNKTSGEVSVFGHSIDTELEAAKACIGIVPQELNINLWDSVMNIVTIQGGFYGLGPRRARERAEVCLRQLQLWDKRKDAGRTLSGGMKRRLTIARSLINRPELLLLDEPTTGLDPQARHVLWDRLFRLKQRGKTFVVTTHYMDEAERLSDRLLVLQAGKVRAAGLPRAVLGDVVGEHVVLLSAQAPEASQVIEWLRGRGARPAQILADWHVALDAPGLAAFVAAFPDLRYEVRPPTLDDLFLALASEEKR